MKAVAILVVLGVAMASAWEMEAKPKPCCTPDQWEGGIGSKGGVLMRHRPIGVASYVKLSYDFKNGRIAMNEKMRFGCKKRMDTVILNFKQKAMYFIVGKKCFKKTLKKPMRKMCVPANSTYVGSFTFGLKPNALTVDSWNFGFKSRHEHFNMDFTLAKGCIPVGESIEGVRLSRKGPIFVNMNAGYINISGGIKDPKVFNPPKSCTSYEKEFEEPEEVNLKYHGFSDDMAHAYERFAELF